MPWKKRLRIFFLAILHAVFMLGLTFYWLSLPYSFGDETFLIKWTSLVKKSLIGIDPKPDPERFLFVDVSKTKTTIDGPNAFGEPSPYYREVITDRQHLAELLRMIVDYGADSPLVFCDVLFADETPADSLLQAQIDRLGKKILGVGHLQEGTQLLTPQLSMPYALSTYQASQGIFLKYPLLLADSLKTAPVVLVEQLHQKIFRKNGIFYRLDGKLSFPSPIIDFKIRSSDFKESNDPSLPQFTIYDLGFVLESEDYMEEQDLEAFFRNKVIFIGDFKEDIHQTPFGKMAGSLIVCNAYLTLLEGENIISFWWMFFMIISFTIISYRILTEQKVKHPRWLVKLFQSKFGQILLNALDEVFFLTIMTVLSYFLFNIHINILILLIYVKMVEYLWKNWRSFPIWNWRPGNILRKKKIKLQ